MNVAYTKQSNVFVSILTRMVTCFILDGIRFLNCNEQLYIKTTNTLTKPVKVNKGIVTHSYCEGRGTSRYFSSHARCNLYRRGSSCQVFQFKIR